MLRILYDDFDQKVKNIHDEMDLHHSYKKKHVPLFLFQSEDLDNWTLIALASIYHPKTNHAVT